MTHSEAYIEGNADAWAEANKVVRDLAETNSRLRTQLAAVRTALLMGDDTTALRVLNEALADAPTNAAPTAEKGGV